MTTITINGKTYELDHLNDTAKAQIQNLRVADAKLAQLQQEAALVQTARNTYAKALTDNLPQ
jgi:hypothetical protein